jgi:thiol:disulfide interchange protein DsbC
MSEEQSKSSGSRAMWQAFALAGVGALILPAALLASDGVTPKVEKALAERLPKTEVTAVDCSKIEGLCEVQAGSNLFYTDGSGRYLVIGRVYDMETKQDLTAARLLEINPDMLVGGAASGGASASADQAGGGEIAGSPRGGSARAQKVSLAELPASGAITWGGGSQTVTVFSDFRCGYCQRLHQTLEDMNVKVVERPISILGTRSLSNAVLCSRDPRKALDEVYSGATISNAGDCDTSGLDANEAFARKHGFSGTPVIVRSDGAVVHGYRPREFLESWLKGEQS